MPNTEKTSHKTGNKNICKGESSIERKEEARIDSKRIMERRVEQNAKHTDVAKDVNTHSAMLC